MHTLGKNLNGIQSFDILWPTSMISEKMSPRHNLHINPPQLCLEGIVYNTISLWEEMPIIMHLLKLNINPNIMPVGGIRGCFHMMSDKNVGGT